VQLVQPCGEVTRPRADKGQPLRHLRPCVDNGEAMQPLAGDGEASLDHAARYCDLTWSTLSHSNNILLSSTAEACDDAARYYLALAMARRYDLLTSTARPFARAVRYYDLARTMTGPYDLLPAMAKRRGHAARFYNLARMMARPQDLLTSTARPFDHAVRYYNLVQTRGYLLQATDEGVVAWHAAVDGGGTCCQPGQRHPATWRGAAVRADGNEAVPPLAADGEALEPVAGDGDAALHRGEALWPTRTAAKQQRHHSLARLAPR
jgi:hypothetical protein